MSEENMKMVVDFLNTAGAKLNEGGLYVFNVLTRHAFIDALICVIVGCVFLAAGIAWGAWIKKNFDDLYDSRELNLLGCVAAILAGIAFIGCNLSGVLVPEYCAIRDIVQATSMIVK